MNTVMALEYIMFPELINRDSHAINLLLKLHEKGVLAKEYQTDNKRQDIINLVKRVNNMTDVAEYWLNEFEVK